MGRKGRIAGKILKKMGKGLVGTPGTDGWGKPKKPSTAWVPKRGSNNSVWDKKKPRW